MNLLINSSTPDPETTIVQPAQTARGLVGSLARAIKRDPQSPFQLLLELADDEEQQFRLARLLAVDPRIAADVSKVIQALIVVGTALDDGCLSGLSDDERVEQAEGDWIYNQRKVTRKRDDQQPCRGLRGTSRTPRQQDLGTKPAADRRDTNQ
jgi:hypothetical protein